MSQITSHILDTAKGQPAQGIQVSLYKVSDQSISKIGSDMTNEDGRSKALLPESTTLEGGIYKVVFDLAPYYEKNGLKPFYPIAEISFSVEAGGEHYHIPLLLSPYGYTTYRGS